MQQNLVESNASVFLMPRLYQETIQLLIEARDYFEHEGKIIEPRLNANQKQLFTMEMSRITLRLSCTMAWLAVQRAIHAGELTREQAQQDYALDGQHICLGSDIAAEHILPQGMQVLLENSRMLYERIHRLDKMH